MTSRSTQPTELEHHPLTPERWPDLETLFGERGAWGGCWCMWWRLSWSEFEPKRGEGTKQALKALVDSGQAPGLLAYANGQPVGWCSLAPREEFPTLERLPRLKKVDDQPVWSVVCFFLAKPFRGQGLTAKLLNAAIDYAKAQGAQIVEAYPVEKKRRGVGYSGYTGMASTFRKAGFAGALRRL